MITAILRDLSREAARDLALRDSEQRYRTLFENSSDLMQIVAPDGRFINVNPAWLRVFGYSRDDLRELTIFDLIDDQCQEHCETIFHQVLTRPGTHQIDTVFRAKNGSRIEIEGNATAIFRDGQAMYTQCIFRDVTQKRRMETELLRAQKLESIGVFAGGLAHDFNNLLTAILGNISLSRVMLPAGSAVDERLEQVEKATIRARGLTRQLLTFARGGAPVRKVSGLADLIRDSIAFPLQGSGIRCLFELADDLWAAEVDRDQFSQVIQNLAINAREAMPDGGTLTVTGRNLDLAPDNRLGLESGPYILVQVRDEGTGIPPEDRQQIFDPYFTRKEQGNGLGLAVAYAVMKKHEGLITVDSEPGSGSTFSLYLPALPGHRPKDEGKIVTAAGHGGRVLIMDDEEMVREISAAMVRHLGYECETAAGGEEALALYREALAAGRPFDAILMDLTIPGGMGGRETMRRLLDLDPRARGIACSGYANDPIMSSFADFGFSGVVPKPYQMEELALALEQVLEGSPSVQG